MQPYGSSPNPESPIQNPASGVPDPESCVPTTREAWLAGREHLAAEGSDAPEIEAEVLLRHAMGVDRSGLFVRWEQAVPDAAWARYREWLEARARGTPLAYLVGEREFMSLALHVDPRVLIPRPETETLVEFLIERFRDARRALIADVGTGSGAIAVSLAAYLPRARLLATDISPDALEVARANAHRHRVADRVAFLSGDLLAPLAPYRGRLDAVAANPPYVPDAEILPREIAEHEPPVALFGGPRGLDAHARLVAGAAPYLRPGGWLALEVAATWDQAAAVARRLKETGGWGEIQVVRDLAGRERVVAARRAAEMREA